MFTNLITLMITVATIISSLFVSVYAQTATPPSSTTTAEPPQLIHPSATAVQILNTSLAGCIEAGFFPFQCASLVYESPTTVVLNGETLIIGGDPRLLQNFENPNTAPQFDPESSPLGNYPNPFLWMAVDGFKAQGYQIDSIVVGGVGSQGNPNEFFVVMSK